MKFCSHCGNRVAQKIPEGDNLPRFVCDHCGAVHYQNPKMVVGCLPIWEDRVLLCRRAIHPRHGYWTLPAGFLENGETTLEGAIRETHEEANAEVDVDELYTMFNLPHINQVYLFFRARLRNLEFSPGLESLETVLFSESNIPWNDLAFPTVGFTLKHYFADRRRGEFVTRVEDVAPARR
ncbi:MAG: NUDIX hydrolase [Pseudomonadota bacterium]|nr:NUDIX hydrolase [Pseudomonadota bacterium]